MTLGVCMPGVAGGSVFKTVTFSTDGTTATTSQQTYSNAGCTTATGTPTVTTDTGLVLTQQQEYKICSQLSASTSVSVSYSSVKPRLPSVPGVVWSGFATSAACLGNQLPTYWNFSSMSTCQPWGATGSTSSSCDVQTLYTKKYTDAACTTLSSNGATTTTFSTLKAAGCSTANPAPRTTDSSDAYLRASCRLANLVPLANGPMNTIEAVDNGGEWWIRKYQLGSKCDSEPLFYRIEPTNIGAHCLPADGLNPTPYAFQCKVGSKRVSVTRTGHAPNDTSCAQPPTGSEVVAYDPKCRTDPRTPGLYVETICGAFPYLSSSTREQLLVKEYSDRDCLNGAYSKATLLGLCGPVYSPGSLTLRTKPEVVYRRKVAFVSTVGGVVSVTEQQFHAEDYTCAAAVIMTRVVSYVDGKCAPDPLYPGLYVKNVARAVGGINLFTAPTWFAQFPGPTTPPTPAPTRPTTSPTPAPTSRPSPSPTPGPTVRPSPAPTFTPGPTVQPSPAPTISPGAIAAADWSTRLTAAGTSASAAVLAAHTTFYNALSTSGLLPKITRLNTFSGNDATAALIPLLVGGGTNTDSIFGGVAFAGSFSQTSGLTSKGTMNTGQRISRTNQLDLTSAASNGINVHLSMYFLGSPVGCRQMGVWRTSVYTRHYLLSDGIGAWGWGSSAGGASQAAGLNVATGTSAGASIYICSKGGSTCSSSSTSVDRSQPSDWPVGVFGCLGSNTGVSTETMQTYTVCDGTRGAGYSIGYALTASDVTALNAAWNQLHTDLGRT